MRYTFANANAPSIKPPQYFEVLGSRGIYADGWIASVFGPRIPWKPGPLAALRDWNPENDIWSLYHVDKDFSERSEEHTSELQSLMRISYAVFCLKKKIKHNAT